MDSSPMDIDEVEQADLHPPAPHSTAPAEQAAGQDRSLLDILAASQAWGLATVRAMDSRSRIAFAGASTECRQWVIEVSEHATVSLLSHGGLHDAAWQRRLAHAERTLQARAAAGRQSNRLICDLRTPNSTSLQSFLGLSQQAACAVAGLVVRQQRRSGGVRVQGVHTLWLQALPAVFASLCTLRIDWLEGCLPLPPLLPHLRELSVVLVWDADLADSDDSAAAGEPEDISDVIASIAPYLTQLTSLDFKTNSMNDLSDEWRELFATSTTTLQRLSTDCELTDTLCELLCTRAPSLTQLGFFLTPEDFDPSRCEHTWSVTEVICDYPYPEQLPQSPAGGLAMYPGDNSRLSWSFSLSGLQGLFDVVRERMPQWHFKAPCDVRLELADTVPAADMQASVEAALRTLSSLPAGSVIEPWAEPQDSWQACLAGAAAAVAAMAPALPHLTIRLPAVPGMDAGMAAVLQLPHAGQHASLYRLDLSGAHAGTPWPWRSLRVDGSASISQLLRVPDPCGGQYVLEIDTLEVDTDEITLTMLPELQRRLQHLTLHSSVWLEAPKHAPWVDQAATLHTSLQLLGNARGYQAPPSSVFHVTLKRWAVGSALIEELRALPIVTCPAELRFYACTWVPDGEYERMASVVPACYTKWLLMESVRHDGFGVEHLMSLCMGAAGWRGSGGEKLTVVCVDGYGGFSDAQRSQVESYLDEHMLREWVEIEWYGDHP